MTPLYKRVLLKLSGEALAGDRQTGIDPKFLEYIASEIKSILALGVQVGLVIGGGNIFRGVSEALRGMDRSAGDNIGMLATVINSLAMHDALEKMQTPSKVLTSFAMTKIAQYYTADLAREYLEKGRVVIVAGGTGNPYFTTDTAAVLRALETDCGLILKATNVDGLYDSDPKRNPNAKFIKRATYMDVISRQLKVMDLTAISLSMENRLPITLFNIKNSGSIANAVCGIETGTTII